MNPTSPEELRTLAREPRHQEWEGRVRAAMLHAAQLLEAADLAVKAEVERAETARRELLARQVPEWRSIDCVPKDGRTILLGYMEDGEMGQTAEMQWSHIQRNGLFPGAVGMWVCPGGNFTWNPEPEEFGPTHWMPLPAAPKADKTKEGGRDA